MSWWAVSPQQARTTTYTPRTTCAAAAAPPKLNVDALMISRVCVSVRVWTLYVCSGSSPWSGNWSRGGGTPTKEPLPTLRGATAARRAFGNLANRRGSAATGAVEPDSSSRGLEALEKKHADLAKSVEMLLAVVENMDMELVGLRKTNRHQARRLVRGFLWTGAFFFYPSRNLRESVRRFSYAIYLRHFATIYNTGKKKVVYLTFRESNTH